jgi:hypothetical protein
MTRVFDNVISMKQVTRDKMTVLVLLGLAGLLSGCASSSDQANHSRYPDRDRFLYPRQYSNSLDPWERAEVERRAEEAQSYPSKRHAE